MASTWKGHIQFFMFIIPVKLYTAEDRSDRIGFNQLHREDLGRIGYVKTCKKCGKEVSTSDIVKGYEYGDDQYIIVEQEDLNKLAIKSTKVLEVSGFIDAKEIHPTLYERPYFAGPDGPLAAKPYALFQQALRDSGKLAIGRVAMHQRESIMALAAHEQGIVAYKLRDPKEMEDMDEVVDGGGEAAIDQKQLKLTEKLFAEMEVSFSDIDFTDRYQQALREMVEAKVEGREFVVIEEEPSQVMDLDTALEQTLRAIEESRGGTTARTAPKPKKTPPRKPVAKDTAKKEPVAKKKRKSA